jgi:hypothetical protein
LHRCRKLKESLLNISIEIRCSEEVKRHDSTVAMLIRLQSFRVWAVVVDTLQDELESFTVYPSQEGRTRGRHLFHGPKARLFVGSLAGFKMARSSREVQPVSRHVEIGKDLIERLLRRR